MKNGVLLTRVAYTLILFVGAIFFQPLYAQSGRVPPHIDLRVQLKGDNGEPLRNQRFSNLLFTVESLFEALSIAGSAVTGSPSTTTSTIVTRTVAYFENHENIWTNYDGYLEVKLGQKNPTEWSTIDWLTDKPLHIRISEGNPRQPGTHERIILYDGALPTVAYSQTTDDFSKPGIGEILFLPKNDDVSLTISAFGEQNSPKLQFRTSNGGDQSYILGIRNNSRDGVPAHETPKGNHLQFYSGLNTFQFQNFQSKKTSISLETLSAPKLSLSGRTSPDSQISISMHDYVYSTAFAIKLDRDEVSLVQSGSDNLFIGDKNGSGEITFQGSNFIFEDGPIEIETDINIFPENEEEWLERGTLFLGTNISEEDYLDDHFRYTVATNTLYGESLKRGLIMMPKRFDINSLGYSLKANQAIIAPSFYATSDQRLKILNSNIEIDPLELLKDLQIRNYRYKDQISISSQNQLGLFAQEVEQVFPQVVGYSKGVIPDIFCFSKTASLSNIDQSLTIEIDAKIDFKVGDHIRIIGHKAHVVEVVKIDKNSFTVNSWPEKNTKQVFVYGRQVDDFRTVDYDQIFTLNVAATQELIKQVEALQAQVADLEAAQTENLELRQTVDALNHRLARIEASLQLDTPSSDSAQTGEK